MPRLDWQMWFAALSPARSNAWFQNLMQRLLEGSPSVIALFADDPFAEMPPRYVRARIARYRFTDHAQRAADGAWWSRAEEHTYAAPTSAANRR
jgi:hypothetical protein